MQLARLVKHLKHICSYKAHYTASVSMANIMLRASKGVTIRNYAGFAMTNVGQQLQCRRYQTEIAHSCLDSFKTSIHSGQSAQARNYAVLAMTHHLKQQQQCRCYQTDIADSSIDSATYERVCAETLDALCDYIEEIVENASDLSGTDVAYSDGVLTINLGQTHGTYVINRQSVNKQIWLSSPTSGPKRFDFVGDISGSSGKWIYKHTGESLHQLLQNEMQQIITAQSLDFMKMPYCS